MQRKTFYDIRNSRIPETLGTCASNTPRLASYVNEAQERLMLAGEERGWNAGWARMCFNVRPCVNNVPASPYLTAPSDVARITGIDICTTPIRIQNEFFEFMEFGVGLQKSLPNCAQGQTNLTQAFDRGSVPTLADLTAGNKLRVYATNASDIAQGKRIFFQAKDTNDNPIYTHDNGVTVTGFFLTLAAPFVDSTYYLNSLIRIQKDVTLGPVSIYQVDSGGTETLLTTLAPGETTPGYRRYLLKNLPCQCTGCDATAGVVQVTAMCKLDLVPVASDTDPLLIQSIPALKHEMLSVHFGEIDSTDAKRLSLENHKEAIRLLNQEISHYIGKENPAIQFRPFGDPRRAIPLRII